MKFLNFEHVLRANCCHEYVIPVINHERQSFCYVLVCGLGKKSVPRSFLAVNPPFESTMTMKRILLVLALIASASARANAFAPRANIKNVAKNVKAKVERSPIAAK